MADTPNHGYNRPDEGEENWHEPLNENFGDFDVDVELRDTEGNLGNYTPEAGAKFLATDTGVVYAGDGSNWNPQFVLPGYDESADEAQFARTVSMPGLTGSLTGGQELTDLAGNNLSIDTNGRLNASGDGSGGGDGSGISSLSGGPGIEPGSIGDGDTLSVAWDDADDLDSNGTLTGGYWTPNNNLLEPADSGIDGIDVDELTCSSTIDAGGLDVGSGRINGETITGRGISASTAITTPAININGDNLGVGTSSPSASLDVDGDVDADTVDTPSINGNGGDLGIGTSSPATPLDIQGQNNWDLDNSDGDVRIGNDDYRLSMGVALGGAGAGNAAIRAKGGDALKLGINSVDALRLGIIPYGNTTAIAATVTGRVLELFDGRYRFGGGGSLTITAPGTSDFPAVRFLDGDQVFEVVGDISATGSKNFVQSVDTDEGEKEVVYTSTEAPTPRTEATGVAELDEGRAEIDLPEHFGWVTDDEEPIHVQTTPYSTDSGGLAAVERSPDRLVIEDLDGEGDYEFSYTVKGTREGHADKEVVREPSREPTGDAGPAVADGGTVEDDR